MSASAENDFCAACMAHADACTCQHCPSCAEHLALEGQPAPVCPECPRCDHCEYETATTVWGESLTALCSDCAASFRKQQAAFARRFPRHFAELEESR